MYNYRSLDLEDWHTINTIFKRYNLRIYLDTPATRLHSFFSCVWTLQILYLGARKPQVLLASQSTTYTAHETPQNCVALDIAQRRELRSAVTSLNAGNCSVP